MKKNDKKLKVLKKLYKKGKRKNQEDTSERLNR